MRDELRAMRAEREKMRAEAVERREKREQRERERALMGGVGTPTAQPLESERRASGMSESGSGGRGTYLSLTMFPPVTHYISTCPQQQLASP